MTQTRDAGPSFLLAIAVWQPGPRAILKLFRRNQPRACCKMFHLE